MARKAIGAAGLAAGLDVARAAHARGSDVIRIALIGCGGRGTGAAVQAMSTKAKVRVELVALADAFKQRLELSLKALKVRCKDKVKVPPERQFVGLDAVGQPSKLLEQHVQGLLRPLRARPGITQHTAALAQRVAYGVNRIDQSAPFPDLGK